MKFSFNFKMDEPIPYVKLLHMAFTDELTGLPNLRNFRFSLQDQINEYKNTKKSFGVLFLDLDNFKKINDDYGHVIGDKFLVESAKQILKVSMSNVFRKAGDEFLIIVRDTKLLESRIRDIQNLLPHVLLIDKVEIPLQVSVGYSIYPIHGQTEEELLSHADRVMYENKRSSK